MVFDKINDEEKKSLISSLIKEIEIFPCDESELPLKSILFNFPVYKDGGDVCGFLWDKSTHVSTWLEMIGSMSLSHFSYFMPLCVCGNISTANLRVRGNISMSKSKNISFKLTLLHFFSFFSGHCSIYYSNIHILCC